MPKIMNPYGAALRSSPSAYSQARYHDGMRSFAERAAGRASPSLGTTTIDILGSGQALMADTTLAFLNSPQFAPFLDAVKNKARDGVIEETKVNAINLLLLAAGAGAVGGFFFRGPRGLFLGGCVALWAVNRMIQGAGDQAS